MLSFCEHLESHLVNVKESVITIGVTMVCLYCNIGHCGRVPNVFSLSKMNVFQITSINIISFSFRTLVVLKNSGWYSHFTSLNCIVNIMDITNFVCIPVANWSGVYGSKLP